jgi:hypothetical protein
MFKPLVFLLNFSLIFSLALPTPTYGRSCNGAIEDLILVHNSFGPAKKGFFRRLNPFKKVEMHEGENIDVEFIEKRAQEFRERRLRGETISPQELKGINDKIALVEASGADQHSLHAAIIHALSVSDPNVRADRVAQLKLKVGRLNLTEGGTYEKKILRQVAELYTLAYANPAEVEALTKYGKINPILLTRVAAYQWDGPRIVENFRRLGFARNQRWYETAHLATRAIIHRAFQGMSIWFAPHIPVPIAYDLKFIQSFPIPDKLAQKVMQSEEGILSISRELHDLYGKQADFEVRYQRFAKIYNRVFGVIFLFVMGYQLKELVSHDYEKFQDKVEFQQQRDETFDRMVLDKDATGFKLTSQEALEIQLYEAIGVKKPAGDQKSPPTEAETKKIQEFIEALSR